jgi:hypothetical protein
VDFQPCGESGDEAVDLFFEFAVGEAWVEKFVEASYAEGCDRAAVWGA